MLDVLAQLEQALPAMLRDESIWHSLYVDYHPPTVERLWAPWRDYRAFLHRIHPCAREQALFHPHPWPSAMRVLEGEYEAWGANQMHLLEIYLSNELVYRLPGLREQGAVCKTRPQILEILLLWC
jgi:hypothetical protein